MENRRVIALGFFDGVHRGHAALLDRARRAADELGVPAAVLTFDLHPDALVLGKKPELINSMEDREDLLLGQFGMDELLVMHFTDHVRHMPWRSFVEDYLIREHGAAHLVCGHDFRFGENGEGTAALLAERCGEKGVGCDIIPAVTMDGVLISSTYIRSLLAEGDLERANRFLGHPHLLSGTVCRGRQLGASIGIPTANISIPAGVLTPALGVYASRVTLPDGTTRTAVTNIGTRPTADNGSDVTVESWLQDFAGDLYGSRIRLELFRRLRPERRFDSLEELAAEIRRNAEEARVLLS